MPQGGKNQTLFSAEPSHEVSQSGHGGGLRTVGRASSSNQGGRGRNGLCDGSAAVNSRSEKTHATERV